MSTISNLLVMGAVLASSTLFAAESQTQAPKTRAAVRQEAIDARAKGELTVGDDPLYPSYRAAPAAKPLKRKSPRQSRPSRAKEVNEGRLPLGVISS